MIRLLPALMLLIVSLMPSSAFASVPDDAVCTQLEPDQGRSGISYYGGPTFCRIIAMTPDAWDYPTVVIKPTAFHRLHLICGWDVSLDHMEYALAWSAYGYEDTAIALCDRMRAGGVAVTTYDPIYPAE